MTSSRTSWQRLRRPALLIGILLAFACGPESFDLDEFVSYFQPEAANTRLEDTPYLFSPQIYHQTDYGYDEEIDLGDSVVADDNIRAWQAYVGPGVSTKAIYDAVYAKRSPNGFTVRLANTKPDAMAYLRLAWDVENTEQLVGEREQSDPQSAPADSVPPPGGSREEMFGLIGQEAEAGYHRTTDPFLKERYAFQAVKIATLARDPQTAVTRYDRLVKPLKTKTFISDWALCRRAGAALATGDTARAIFDFAQVFDRCPSRREAAEHSLRMHHLRFRQAALLPAQTNRERAAVYALCAIQPGQDALELLKNMVALRPDNPLNELVMAREINRNEYYFLSERRPITIDGEAALLTDSLRMARKLADGPSYFDKLRAFAQDAAKNDKLTDNAFWLTALAYLDFLAKDYPAAQTQLNAAAAALAARPRASAETLPKQIALQRLLLLSARTTTVTPEAETQLIGFLEQFGQSNSFRLNNAYVRVCREFADKYSGTPAPTGGGLLGGCQRNADRQNDANSLAKAWLLTMLTGYQHHQKNIRFDNSGDQYASEDSSSAATVQGVIAYAHRPDATDFDKRLVRLAGFDDAYFSLLLGRRSLAEHRYAQAATAFAQVAPGTWRAEPFVTWFAKNPFSVQLPGDDSRNGFSPLSFARKMADLETRAKAATGDEAAELYHQLGCGALNLSWYGNAWLLIRRHWSAGDVDLYLPRDQATRERRYQQLLADPYFTNAPAKAFFAGALKAARSPKLADRAAYLLARCEANAFASRRALEQARLGDTYYYLSDVKKAEFEQQMTTLRANEYGMAFSDLLKNHVQGRFHTDMIRECPLYADFLTGSTDAPGN